MPTNSHGRWGLPLAEFEKSRGIPEVLYGFNSLESRLSGNGKDRGRSGLTRYSDGGTMILLELSRVPARESSIPFILSCTDINLYLIVFDIHSLGFNFLLPHSLKYTQGIYQPKPFGCGCPDILLGQVVEDLFVAPPETLSCLLIPTPRVGK
jgi:hypothetical protein